MLDRRRLLQSGLAALAIGSAGGAARATIAKRLGTPTHECIYPAEAFEKEVPRVDKGFLVSKLGGPQIQGASRNLAVYSRTGELLYDINFLVPDAHQTSVEDVALTPEGSAVVGAAAVDASGRIARVLVILTKIGSVAQVVRTNPFQAHHVRCASDGTIWALGREFHEGADFRPHELVHKYDSTGILKGKFLLAGDKQYAALTTAGSPVAFEACGNGVVFYVARSTEYIEATAEGEVITGGYAETPAETFYPSSPAGMAITESGDLFGLFRPGNDQALYQLNRSTMTWDIVPGTLATTRDADLQHLCGADGETLVFRTRERNRLVWREVIT